MTQDSKLDGMVINAQLSMTFTKYSQANYIDEELWMQNPQGSQMLFAASDSEDGPPILAITSLVDARQHVTIDCITSSGATQSKLVAVEARQTLLTHACGKSGRQLYELMGSQEEDAESEGLEGPIGIAIRTDAKPGSVAAFALAPHQRDQARFFSAVPFSDPKMLLSSTTVFAGVPVGQSDVRLPGTPLKVSDSRLS